MPPRPAQVTVKFADGSATSGTLQRMDDFIVSLRTQEGQYRSYHAAQCHADASPPSR